MDRDAGGGGNVSRLGRDAASAFALQGISYVLGFAVTVVMARLLGPSLKGSINLAAVIAGLSATLFGLGLGTSMTVGFREGWADDRMAVSLWLYVIGTAALAAVLFHVAGVARALGLGPYPGVLLPAAVTIGGLLANEFAAGILQGKGRARAGATARLGVGLLQSIALLVLLAAGVGDVAGYVWAAAAAAWVSAAVAWAAVRPGMPGLPPRAQVARVVGLGVRSQLVWVLLLLNYRLDMVILGAMAGTGQVGVYAIAVGFSEVAWLGVNALTAVLLPHLSAQAESDRLRRVSVATRLSVAVTLAIATVFVAVLYAVAVPLFGPAFAGVAPAFLALSVGLVAFCPFKVIATYYVAAKEPGVPAGIAGISLAVNILANVVLIPRLGSTGAGLASSISYLTASVLLVRRFTNRTGSAKRGLLVLKSEDVRLLSDLVSGARAA